MRSEYEQQDPMMSASYRELQLLTEVDETPSVTQRQLSVKIGVALGLTNVMLRNLVQKGYLRVSSASWKRRLYNLTPEGLSHKLRLTSAYVHRVLEHYQTVRETLREQMAVMAVNEESRIAIFGTSDFAELVFLGLKEIGIEEIDVYSTGISEGRWFLGMPVRDIATIQADNYDRIVVALLGDSQAASRRLLDQGAPPHKVVTFFAEASATAVGGGE